MKIDQLLPGGIKDPMTIFQRIVAGLDSCSESRVFQGRFFPNSDLTRNRMILAQRRIYAKFTFQSGLNITTEMQGPALLQVSKRLAKGEILGNRQ